MPSSQHLLLLASPSSLQNYPTNQSSSSLTPPPSPSSLLHSLLIPNHNAFNPSAVLSLLFHINVLFAIVAATSLLVIWLASCLLLDRKKQFQDNRYHRLGRVLINIILQFFAYSYLSYSAFGYSELSTKQFLDSFSLFLPSSPVINLAVTSASIGALVLPIHYFSSQSPLLIGFWLLNALQNFTVVLQDTFSNYPIYPTTGTVPAILKWFVLSNSILISVYQLHQQQPSSSSNIIGKLTFSWLNPLITDGYTKRYISPDDIAHLNVKINYSPYFAKLLHNWNISKHAAAASASKSAGVVTHSDKKLTPFDLLICLAKTFGFKIFFIVLIQFAENVVCFIQPQLLRQLIKFFNDYDRSSNDPPLLLGFLISSAMFVVSLITTNLYNQFFIQLYKTGLYIKGSLMSLVYTKGLRLSQKSRLDKSTGDVINLVAIDVNRIQNLSQQIQLFVSIPTKLTLSVMSLYYLLGNAVIGGLLAVAIMIPVNTLLLKLLKNLNRSQMKYKDSRIKIISEVLNSIKSVKLYGWESSMLNKINHIRNKKELQNLKKIGLVISVNQFFWCLIPLLILCSTFFFYQKPLTSDIIFPALSLFHIFTGPVVLLPSLITSVIEASIALDRLTEYLNCEEKGEIPASNFTVDSSHTPRDRPQIQINNCDFLWDSDLLQKRLALSQLKQSSSYDEEAALLIQEKDSAKSSNKIALQNINLQVKNSEFVCVLGNVGSGKSTLLNAILGELPVLPKLTKNDNYNNSCSSKFSVNGSVAYCSQIPWILNTTVKENILFGSPYDEMRYFETINACDLADDLTILPNADETLVGEKGISLSGGQKARLSLARAVYANKDIYILDDILSAVDNHVAKNIIYKVLSSESGMLKDKIRVLVTNNLSVLRFASQVVYLKKSKITETGNLNDLLVNKDSNVGKLLASTNTWEGSHDLLFDLASDDNNNSTADSDSIISSEENSETSETSSVCSFDRSSSSLSSLESNNDDETKLKLAKKLSPAKVAVEDTGNGGIKWSTYTQYAKSCSISGIVLFLFMIFVSSTFQLMSNYWLKNWSEKNDKYNIPASEHGASSGSPSSSSIKYFVSIYLVLGLSSSVFVFLKAFVLYQYCSISASSNLHKLMTNAILKSPMSFFDTTPLGRILNRFSNDINKIDESLPKTFSKFFTSLVSTVFTLGIIIYHLPVFLVPMAALVLIYYYYQMYYVIASRDMKRIGSTSRSPIFNHLQESLLGCETIRSYAKSQNFESINSKHINFNLKALFVFRSVNRWLSFRLQLIGAVVIFLTSTLSLCSLTTSHPLTNGIVGLIMSYALEITESLNWIVRSSVEIETNIVCVERVLEYSNLKPEAPHYKKTFPLPMQSQTCWPSAGTIEFINYTTKYRPELDYVLRNLSFSIQAKEKIGIVGRTGAGKSSLALAIFRLIEAYQGSIKIDNAQIDELGLHQLRSSLSIIPQDCLAIEGSVRDNLDPLRKHDDQDIMKAIELSHLKEHLEHYCAANNDGAENIEDVSNDENKATVSAKFQLLDTKVCEGGRNLSVGQRQLLCLARALLNPSKVLILDEATAAVDANTDKIIQETIRKEFRDKTILTIAHRLDTVMDCDKIMVLDYGKIVEFDDPKKLLKNKFSFFYKLCDEGMCLKGNDEGTR